MAIDRSIGFIGGGTMGEALIRGLITSERAMPEQIVVSEPIPARREYLRQKYRIRLAPNNVALVQSVQIVVLAVKPQFMDEVLKEIYEHLSRKQLVISIAAGFTLNRLQESIPVNAPVVRSMPNIPALVMRGVTAVAPGVHATQEHLALAQAVFEAVGLVVVVDEKDMDVVTGLSGSGPAYIFVLLEAMTDAGVRLGLFRSQAKALAAQTILGAARLALETDTHPAALKDMVTTPGGTAAAGLHALETKGFRAAIMEAIAAATARAKELGKR